MEMFSLHLSQTVAGGRVHLRTPWFFGISAPYCRSLILFFVLRLMYSALKQILFTQLLPFETYRASLVAQTIKNLPAIQETWL